MTDTSQISASLLFFLPPPLHGTSTTQSLLNFVAPHLLRPQFLHQLAAGGDSSSILLDDLWRVRISGSAGLEIWWENVLSGPHIRLLYFN